jgi:hypothetical protein
MDNHWLKYITYPTARRLEFFMLRLLRADDTATKLRMADMDWPPPPPSPFDEVERRKRRVAKRAQFLKLMKQNFPGLPY